MVDLLHEMTFTTKPKVIPIVQSESISIPTDPCHPLSSYTKYKRSMFPSSCRTSTICFLHKSSLNVQSTLIFLASFFAFASIFAYVSSSTYLSCRTTCVLKFHLSDEVFLIGNLISVTICSLIFFICPH